MQVSLLIKNPGVEKTKCKYKLTEERVQEKDGDKKNCIRPWAVIHTRLLACTHYTAMPLTQAQIHVDHVLKLHYYCLLDGYFKTCINDAEIHFLMNIKSGLENYNTYSKCYFTNVTPQS